MKFLLLLFCTTVAFGQAPDTVSGLIFRLHAVNIPGAGNNPISENQAFLLNADGTYLQLYSIRWAFRSMPQWTYQEPTSGTYSYRKIDATTATLALRQDGQNSTGTGSTLTFTAPMMGTASVGQIFHFSDSKVANPLTNLSTRLHVPAGRSIVVGFVAGGPGIRSLLIRAVGPGLASYGVTGTLKDPRMTVYRTPGVFDAQTNDDWELGNSLTAIRRVQTLVGAFPLASATKDACLIYSADFRSSTGGGQGSIIVDSTDPSDSGEVLVEIYVIP